MYLSWNVSPWPTKKDSTIFEDALWAKSDFVVQWYPNNTSKIKIFPWLKKEYVICKNHLYLRQECPGLVFFPLKPLTRGYMLNEVSLSAALAYDVISTCCTYASVDLIAVFATWLLPATGHNYHIWLVRTDRAKGARTSRLSPYQINTYLGASCSVSVRQ